MRNAIFTCPSLFASDYEEIEDLSDAVYSHKGEIDIPLSPRPVLIRGLSRPIVFVKDGLIWGNRYIPAQAKSAKITKDIECLKTTMGRFCA